MPFLKAAHKVGFSAYKQHTRWEAMRKENNTHAVKHATPVCWLYTPTGHVWFMF